jgi:hypothetical protein
MDVTVVNEQNEVVAHYIVDDSEWSCIIDKLKNIKAENIGPMDN